MKIGILAIVFTLSCFATITPPGTPIAVQCGSLAILGWAFWYLLSKHLPGERKIFLVEQNKMRSDYMDSNKNMAEAVDRLANAIENLERRLWHST